VIDMDESRPLLQAPWDCLRLQYGPFLASPLFPVCLGIGSYIIICLPFTAFDLADQRLPWIHRYKIQNQIRVTRILLKDVLLQLLWTHVTYILPLSIAQFLFQEPSMLPVEAPTITEITIHWAICFVVFDTEYYVWHVIHHKVSFLYKHIHSFHHRLRSPFSWGTQYVHPIELFFTVLFTMSTPLLLGSHPITFWIWMVTGYLNVLQSVSVVIELFNYTCLHAYIFIVFYLFLYCSYLRQRRKSHRV
jgi:cholesterol 25-hydroxylase